MNKPTHKTLLLGGFSALMLFIALFTAIAYDSLVKTTEINRNDKATLVILKNTEDVFVDMTDLETGYRGYLLTSNKMFLEPYQKALANFEGHHSALQNMEVGDKKEQQQLLQLAKLSTLHLNFGKELIARYNKHEIAGFDTAAAMLQGKLLMDSIRNLAALVENRERINLAIFDNQKADNAQMVFLFILCFSAVAIVVFIGFSQVIKKNVIQRERAEDMLIKLNRQLENKVTERTTELQKTTDLMSSILNRISDGFIALDNNSCYTYVNKVAGEILKHEPASLIGRNMWEVFPEEKEKPFSHLYKNALANQQTIKSEEYYAPAGLWLENHIYPSPHGVSIYFSDITKRKKDEQEIRENERNLKQAEIAAKFGYWKLLVDKQMAYCSDGARTIYGADKNVFTNEEVISFRLPEYGPMLNEEMRALLQDGKPFNVQFKIKRQSDGAIIDVHSTAEYNPQEKTVFGILKDITESKNAERARQKAEDSHRESEENLKRAELVARLGHWKMDMRDKIIYGSEGTMNVYGLEKQTLTYQEISRMRMPEYNTLMDEAFRALAEEGKPFDLEYKIKRKSDGQIVDIRLLSEYDPKSNMVFGIVQDITERKKAELDLLESEKKYRLLFYNNPMPMFMLSLPGFSFADVNEAAIRHYGFTRTEFLSMNVRDLRPVEDLQRFEKEIVPASFKGTNFLGKWTHLKKDGSRCIVELTTHEVQGTGGKLRLILINDVTEREEALNNLKNTIKELSVYKAALDSAAIIAITDPQGHITHVNDNFCNISKYTRAELIGADHRIINSGYHSKAFMRNLWNTIARGEIWVGEIRNKNKDGNYYWVYSTIVPFLNEAGKPYQYLSIRWDITTRKNAEDEIRELYTKLLSANQQLTTVLNTLPANIAVLDNEGTITGTNKAWQQFAHNNNLPAVADCVGVNYIKVCENTNGDGVIDALKMADSIKQILSGELTDISLEYPCHSPTERRWFRAEVRPLEKGGKTGAVVMHVNITERKLAEEAINEMNSQLEQRVMDRTADLTQANKALEAFSYSVSHDLRAPVRSIIGFAKIIMKDYGHELNDDVKELFAHIDSSSKRMNAIIDDMLTLAKYEKEKTNLTKVDMTKLFNQVWYNILYTTPHHARLQLSELPEVEVDMSMIEQVVVNLLSNAVKYSSKKEQPVIIVGYTKTDTAVTFYVKDNGAGFDMKNQNRLFGAFQRLHGTSEFEGTGVGLLLVKKIIERHGGQVWAEGEVDKGATFYFSLPCGKGV